MTCPRCQTPMTEERLESHLGRPIAIDLCLSCQSFWFDSSESLQLSPASILTLFRIIGDRAAPPRASEDAARCPRCSVPLRRVHDQQHRFDGRPEPLGIRELVHRVVHRRRPGRCPAPSASGRTRARCVGRPAGLGLLRGLGRPPGYPGGAGRELRIRLLALLARRVARRPFGEPAPAGRTCPG